MTVAYPYIHPAPFQCEMRYDYADCRSDAFIQGWKLARAEAKTRFLNAKYVEASLPEPPSGLENSLSGLLRKCQSEDNDTASTTLWALIKKYEVFGRLHSHYTPELRKHDQSRPAVLSDYILFAQTLLKSAENETVLQYLSTLLKIMDTFCSLDADSSSQEEAAQIVALIDAEKSIIGKVGA